VTGVCTVQLQLSVIGCLHDPANVQQTSSKCIQNTLANAGRLLDRVNTPLLTSVSNAAMQLAVNLVTNHSHIVVATIIKLN